MSQIRVMLLQITLPSGEVLEVYRSDTGGLYAVDATYLDQVGPEHHDPFTGDECEAEDLAVSIAPCVTIPQQVGS